MCDLQGPPIKIINKKTNEEIIPKYNGHGVWFGEIAEPKFGIYHIGASGCGYYLYDNGWNIVPFNNEDEKYIYIRDLQKCEECGTEFPIAANAILSIYCDKCQKYTEPKIKSKDTLQIKFIN